MWAGWAQSLRLLVSAATPVSPLVLYTQPCAGKGNMWAGWAQLLRLLASVARPHFISYMQTCGRTSTAEKRGLMKAGCMWFSPGEEAAERRRQGLPPGKADCTAGMIYEGGNAPSRPPLVFGMPFPPPHSVARLPLQGLVMEGTHLNV